MKEITVTFVGVEKAPDDKLAIIYIPTQKQVLLPGRKYRIIIDGLSYEGSNSKNS